MPIEDAVLGSAGVMLDHLTSEQPLVGEILPAQSSVTALVLHAIGTTSVANGTIPPMLHVHCCLFGVLDADERLTQPDILRLADAVGELELADRIGQIGYSVNNTAGRGNHSFEIAGVPQKLLDADFWRNTGCANPPQVREPDSQRPERSIPEGYREVVICDFCNRDYTDSSESGGFITESRSYATCPRCAKNGSTRSPSDIPCPEGMSFSEFIMRYR